jgi:formylmethanofuran dehydrogenase subunit E
MAMLGCRLIGLDNPAGCRKQIKKLLVYVEMDRCTADAVAHVTGVKLGRRSLKFMDYGIMAATFVNLETGQAYRVISTEDSRDLCDVYAPEIADQREQQLTAYQRMPESVLFRVQLVHVAVDELDLPGPTRQKVTSPGAARWSETAGTGWKAASLCAGSARARGIFPMPGRSPGRGWTSHRPFEKEDTTC